jgi:hypothetical protein
VTLSFIDKQQFLTVIQPVPAPAESAADESPPADPARAESPPADPAPVESSAKPLHSAAGDALTETY